VKWTTILVKLKQIVKWTTNSEMENSVILKNNEMKNSLIMND